MNVTTKLQGYQAIIVEHISQKIGFVFILLMKRRNLNMVSQTGYKRIQLTYNENNLKFIDSHVRKKVECGEKWNAAKNADTNDTAICIE